MRATAKTLSYIKRMITMKRWRDVIPPIKEIAERLSVSGPTVRKAVRILEKQKVVENNGSLGYGIIPRQIGDLYKTNKRAFYLALLKRNMQIADLLDRGGKIVGNFVFLGNKHALTVANIATGKVVKTNAKELYEMTRNPITVDSLLCLQGTKLRTEKTKYLRQRKLITIKDLVLRHRKELGL